MIATALPVNQRLRINTLRFTFLLVLPLVVAAAPLGADRTWFPLLQLAGLGLIIASVLGRFWSILYIGGHKNLEVVQQGPYSMCRHPLYFFSTLGVVGFALHLGSVTVALVLGSLTFLILRVTAAREEAYLRSTFGQAYQDYARRTPAILPDPRLFHTECEVTFSTGVLRRNLMDGLVFLAFIPLAWLIRSLQEHGIVPVLAVW